MLDDLAIRLRQNIGFVTAISTGTVCAIANMASAKTSSLFWISTAEEKPFGCAR